MEPFLFDLNAIGLAAGGVLALPALISEPGRGIQRLRAILLPFQALLGVGLIALGIVDGVWELPKLMHPVGLNEVSAGINLILAGASIVLGGLYGVQIIARLFRDGSPRRASAMALADSLGPYLGMLGIVAIVAPLIYFGYRFHWLDWVHA